MGVSEVLIATGKLYDIIMISENHSTVASCRASACPQSSVYLIVISRRGFKIKLFTTTEFFVVSFVILFPASKIFSEIHKSQIMRTK